MTSKAKQEGSSFSEFCGCGCFPSTNILDNSDNPKQRTLWVTLLLLGNLVIAELGIGYWSGSLSLAADAGHLAADIVFIGLTLGSLWFSRRPASKRASFGHRRIETLSAFLNGLGLLFIALWIASESLSRLHSPGTIAGIPMLIGATLGVGINSISISLLHQHSHNDLSIRGAILHLFADAASSFSILITAVMIYFWHWSWLDPVTSLFIASLTGISALPLLFESAEILLEYAPRSVDIERVESTLQNYPEVEQVIQLSIWALSPGQVALATQLQVDHALDSTHRDHFLLKLRHDLSELFGVETAVIEMVAAHSSNDGATDVQLHPLMSSSLASLVFQSSRKSSRVPQDSTPLTTTVPVYRS